LLDRLALDREAKNFISRKSREQSRFCAVEGRKTQPLANIDQGRVIRYQR
jgi:hypothetical protein